MTNQNNGTKTAKKKITVKKVKKTNNGNGKKKFQIKAWMIIIVVLAAIGIGLISWLGGWSSYIENSFKYNDAVGTWQMDSFYVNTKSKTYEPTVLVLNKDMTGSITVTKTITPEKENADGTVTPAVTEDKTTTISISASGKSEDGKYGLMTITSGETSVNYEFSVDEDGGILHLYTTIDDKVYHYIYDLVE